MAKSSNQKNGSQKNSMGGAVTINPKHSRLMEFFVDELKDVYYAEKLLVKALAKMSKNATTPDLKQAFTDHRAETEVHVSRLEQVFEMIGKKAQAKKCEAMTGIVEEASSILEDTKADTLTRDAGIIMGAQKAEHYEIATYGGLVTLAKTMGHDEVADLLYQTLEEEKAADQKLTGLAEAGINSGADEEDADEEEDAPKKSTAKKSAPKKSK